MAFQLLPKGNLWRSTPIQCRHDSGYGSYDSLSRKEIDISPIRKKAPPKSSLASVLHTCGILDTKSAEHFNSDLNKVSRKLVFTNLSNVKTNTPPVDSGIDCNENLSNPKNQSLHSMLTSFPTDENCNFISNFKTNWSTFYQPSKYVCKEDIKKCDWSLSNVCSSEVLNNDNSTIDYIKVIRKNNTPCFDLLKELNLRNCTFILSLILSNLPDEDVRRASNVCKEWQFIVFNDKKANERRKAYINNRKNVTRGPNKENRFQTKYPFERSHKSVFRNKINISTKVPEQPLNYDALLGRFDSYIQEVKVLHATENLMKCPKCYYPSKTVSGNKYCCTRNLCQHEFCKECLGPYLDNHFCTIPELNATAPNIIIGSKKSIKNLRRL